MHDHITLNVPPICSQFMAVNEFLQIGSYAEKNVEALLRTKIQQYKQTVFIFSRMAEKSLLISEIAII